MRIVNSFDPRTFAWINVDPVGTYEMPAQNSGDLRIEKIIRVRSANIGLYGDLFNVANHIVAGRINNVSGSAFGQVRWYTSPREFRAGVRVTF